jgi:RNA polymerase sigma-70 factor (ECF subfamily)
VDYSSSSSEDLVRACAQTGDSAAWEEFVRRFHRLIATVVLRTARRWGGTTPAQIDELVQDTYLKLCADQARLLRSFGSRHEDAIFGYLKVVTANIVHDHFRSVRAQKRGGGAGTEELEAEYGPAPLEAASTSGASAVEQQVLFSEIDVNLRAVLEGPHATRDRRIFWLYYRVGLPAASIAGLPGIGLSTKGVESTLLRLTRQVRQRLALRPASLPETSPGEGIQAAEPF